MKQENHSHSSAGQSSRQLQLQSDTKLVLADKLEQVDDIVKVLVLAIKDSPYSSFPIDEEHLKATVVEFVNSDFTDKVLLLLIKGDIITGLLAATCGHGHPLAKKVKMATELVWWVHPDHRGSKDSFMLYEAFEAWAKEVKATHIVGSHFSNKIGKNISKYYLSKGYSRLEEAYMKENN